MREHVFNGFTRMTDDAITRRRSLMTLGGAAMAAALSGPALAEARKKGKKGRNTRKKTCQKQGAPCREFVDQFCELFFPPGPGRDFCLAGASPCCSSIEQCRGEEFFACLFEAIRSN
jgi:hypothetical protein